MADLIAASPPFLESSLARTRYSSQLNVTPQTPEDTQLQYTRAKIRGGPTHHPTIDPRACQICRVTGRHRGRIGSWPAVPRRNLLRRCAENATLQRHRSQTAIQYEVVPR